MTGDEVLCVPPNCSLPDAAEIMLNKQVGSWQGAALWSRVSGAAGGWLWCRRCSGRPRSPPPPGPAGLCRALLQRPLTPRLACTDPARPLARLPAIARTLRPAGDTPACGGGRRGGGRAQPPGHPASAAHLQQPLRLSRSRLNCHAGRRDGSILHRGWGQLLSRYSAGSCWWHVARLQRLHTVVLYSTNMLACTIIGPAGLMGETCTQDPALRTAKHGWHSVKALGKSSERNIRPSSPCSPFSPARHQPCAALLLPHIPDTHPQARQGSRGRSARSISSCPGQ